MKNVIFGNYDAYRDWDLIRTGMTIGTPEIKTEYVEIEGADGEIDLTEYFGKINYKNRPLTFEFATVKRQDEFTELFSQIQNAIHGKRMLVRPSDELDFYYMGRIKVNEWKSDKVIGRIVIDVNADPYKYKNNPTTVSKVLNGTERVSCYNLRKEVVPEITVSGTATIVFRTYAMDGTLEKEHQFTVTSATYPYTFTRPEILFKEGENILEVTMNGTVIIKYQEGAL